MEILSEKDKIKKWERMSKPRNLSNHAHNCKVLGKCAGSFIVGYRSSRKVSAEEYAPCDHCLEYLVRTDLWKPQCKVGTSYTARVSNKPR